MAVITFGATTKNGRDFDSSLLIRVGDGGGMLRNFTFPHTKTDVVGLQNVFYEQMGGNDGGGAGTGKQIFYLVFVILDVHVRY